MNEVAGACWTIDVTGGEDEPGTLGAFHRVRPPTAAIAATTVAVSIAANARACRWGFVLMRRCCTTPRPKPGTSGQKDLAKIP